MSMKLDPEVEAALAPLMAAMANIPKLEVGDVAGRRQAFDGFMSMLFGAMPKPTDVIRKDFHATTADGHSLSMRWFAKESNKAPFAATPAVLYLHGGGMIIGSVELYDPLLATYVSQSGVPMLAVDFRNKPESPAPTIAEDCYVGLTYLREHAAELGVDPARIAVMGDSGGGCLAAAVAIMARDKGFSPPLAKQILIYPMLDDRTTKPDPALMPFAIWSYDDNVTGWSAVLGKTPKELLDMHASGADVSPYAAPARVADCAGLPPTYIEVGDLDVFRDEDIEYARRITKAGINCELHVHAGCPHAWEGVAPNAEVSKRSGADRIRAMQTIGSGPKL